MRILFLSDFYPPVRAGGYAQLCAEVAQQLGLRGHQVWILTSNYLRRLAPPGESRVFRLLHLEGALDYYRPLEFLLLWKRRNEENRRIFQEVVAKINPGVILIWNLRRLSKALCVTPEGWAYPPTAYYLAGYWPIAENIHEAYWRKPAQHRYLRIPKRTIQAIALHQLNGRGTGEPAFRYVMCVSKGLKEALIAKGLPIESAQVVYNGVDPDAFSRKDESLPNSKSPDSFRLLYAGQIVPQKGVHTAIEALDLLVHGRSIEHVHLTILGNGHPAYESYLRDLTLDRGLQSFVEFLPAIPREEMPAFLRQFNAMVHPSIYKEPLARSIQEAMACSLVVLGTLTGGTSEILIDGENGLSFLPGDSGSLACQLERLVLDPELQERLARAGRKTIVERFDIRRSVDEIETFLKNIMMSASTHQKLVPSV